MSGIRADGTSQLMVNEPFITVLTLSITKHSSLKLTIVQNLVEKLNSVSSLQSEGFSIILQLTCMRKTYIGQMINLSAAVQLTDL